MQDAFRKVTGFEAQIKWFFHLAKGT